MPMILTPLNEGEPIAIDKAVTFFGRHPDCDLVVPDPHASRKQLAIDVDEVNARKAAGIASQIG